MSTLTLETYQFSYSRSTGKMRFRLPGQDILADRLVGQWVVKGVDREGNITAECAVDARASGGSVTAYVYHPDMELVEVGEASDHCDFDTDNTHDNCHIATENAFPQGRDTHWRICYAREIATTSDNPCWRLRDERTDELWFVHGYEGPMNVNYFDHGSHVFADGACWVDEDQVAHFGEPS